MRASALLAAALLLLTEARGAPPQRVLIDTDCGVFGDDGVAITMLARYPDRVRIEALTVVSGNVWAGSAFENVRNLTRLLGIQLPIAAGASMPLIHTAAMASEEERLWGPLEFQGAFAAKPVEPPASGGVQVLIDTIERNPGAITIVAIGPMTNLAIALSLRPDIATKIGRLVFMGGNVHVPGNANRTAEFNFWFDPEAAKAVLRSPIPEKVMFGLDVSAHAIITRAHFDRITRADTPIARLYRDDFGNRYPGFLNRADVKGSLWDELPAAWLIDASVFTKSEERFLDVVTQFGPKYGSVVDLQRRMAPDATPVRVMLDLDFEKALSIYERALTAR